ncbi:phenylacetic acid degradation protein [Pararhodobacter marinus]|uniref:Phenylacetic acid degradation protein n=1 Tax=Pararhodobacter marinus TaxID=2184063 RepID=A0A2U2C5G1_9RHOB|nr:PaaI family thioesterase [Pararhodobacter marinus]PWE27071.1 phenylacetic acid degradation protein [Pararhodobacter marinus]
MTDISMETRVRASFAQQTMMQTLAASLISVEPGRCVIRAPIVDHLRQQHGAAHAGLAFTLGDTAAGYAALSMMPGDTEVMTVEMKINLLSPALGEALEAVGQVMRAGKRLTIVTAEVFALQGETRKSVALLQGTMIPVAQR